MWKLALIFAATAAVLLAWTLVSKRGRDNKRPLVFIAAVCAFVAMVLGRYVGSPKLKPAKIEDFAPVEMAGTSGDPMASSGACIDCHQDQYESWHASWHRTMTQEATGESIIGDFEDVRTSAYGRDIALSRRDGVFWATMHNPEKPIADDNPDVDWPIVMTTGSHHMQVYWYATGKTAAWHSFPLSG